MHIAPLCVQLSTFRTAGCVSKPEEFQKLCQNSYKSSVLEANSQFMSAHLCCLDNNNCHDLKENKHHIYYLDRTRGVAHRDTVWNKVTQCIASLDRCWQEEQVSNYFLTGLLKLMFLSFCTSRSLSRNGFAALAPSERNKDFSRASGPEQVPERCVIPPARARGCLASHFWDKPNFPASFHPSENKFHSILLGSDLYPLLSFQYEDTSLLLCFTWLR